ncbi:MAG: Nudix family hydrolase [Betaproteobacteria bacterium]
MGNELRRQDANAQRPLTRVAAAVILRDDGGVLLAQRPAGKPYAGYWEFPGGKLEPGETPRHALDRELREELGLDVVRAAPWFIQRHDYPHADVELNFFRVFAWRGEPVGHDGQAFAWQVPGTIDVAPLLPANTRVLAALTLPVLYGITCADDAGEAAFLVGAERAFAQGLRLAVVREKTWPVARLESFAAAMLALASAHGARLLLNGDEALARRLGFAGVHWTAQRLAAATSRPDAMMVAASLHTREELAKASRLGLDFGMLGPVRVTPTHGDTAPLGFDGFAALIDRAELPVFALGGLTMGDLGVAIEHGAHGVALRRAAWSAT